MTLTLRPYQQEAFAAIHEHICTRQDNPCVVLPTGSGKSLLIAWCNSQWIGAHSHFRSAILAHRKELVLQNYNEFNDLWQRENLGPPVAGIYSASLKRRDYDAQILFASIDSIYKRANEFKPFHAIFVDEAHRIPIKGEGKYLTFLRECQRWNPNLRIIGMTATPFRMSAGPICHKDHMLNHVCYEANVLDLINAGYLSKLRAKIGVTVPDLESVKKRGGEYVTASLSKATNRRDVVTRAIREAMFIIKAEQRRSVVFFCVDIEHCRMVSEELRTHGLHAPPVTSKTPHQERDFIANAFKRGQLRGVCNVNVYTEGFNATGIDCIVLLRPTLSPGLFSQMVGRGLRLHAGKLDCLILDFARCIEEHGPIDLLGANAKVVLATCLKCRESFSRACGSCPRCGWVIPKRVIEEMERKEAERRMHDVKVSGEAILSGMPITHKVHDVFVGPHVKTGKPTSLCVRYRCGLQQFREWVCLDHEGPAGAIAQKWWAERFGKQKDKVKVSDALSSLFTTQVIKEYTKTITVKRDGRYWRIVGYNQPIGIQ